ncbi:MAG: hypothetical protein AAGL11_06290 [Pseudomonadota bacterium]
MSASNRTPTTRLLALAALLLAAGVFALRATDIFSAPMPAPIGDRAEQELTYLLEPITGADKVRVSVTGRTDRQILIMIDGTVASDMRASRTQIEAVLAASIGYNAETDTLTLTQFPFARGVGANLTPMQIAELTSLGLLCGLLLISLLNSPATRSIEPMQPAPAPSDPYPAQPARLAAPAPSPAEGSDLQTASTLAESKPNETARLVRGWMSYAEE